MRIGIPRGLLYFDYYPLWEGFFRNLGCEVIVSEPTNAKIAGMGVKITCDEVCYPVKVLHGHVLSLVERVDRIFVPRIFSVQPGTCSCPKLIGLADMVRHAVPDAPPLVAPFVNLRLGRRGMSRALREAAAGITNNPVRIYRAYRAALRDLAAYQRNMHTGRLAAAMDVACSAAPEIGKSVAVIGHSYNLYDSHLNLNLIQRLISLGYRVYTPEMLPDKTTAAANRSLRKPLFWSLGRKVLGAAIHYSQRRDIAGIIQVTSFGCGLESLIADMAQRVAKQKGKPFMLLTMDEHTGEAGMQTRLEAFLDMLAFKE